MLKSYLLTALRFFRRQRTYAVVNVLGLAVGLACSFLILLWVQGELRFDRFHDQQSDLYVAKRHAYFSDGQVFTWVSVPKQVSRALEAQYPEVVDAEMVSFQNEAVLSAGGPSFREEGYWADEAFFEMFSFPLVEGDPATALDAPDGIILSEAAAERLFGPSWRADGVLGRPVRVDDRHDAQVTGVAAAVPDHSTLQFDFVLPAAEFYGRNEWVEHWGNSGMQLFVRLRPGADAEALNAQIKDIIRENHEGATADVFLQPYGDMYLYGRFEDARLVGGRIDYVRIFIAVAGFVLLIACINFMNLATARAAQRAREIGVRKAVGASRGALVTQFLGESVLMAAMAFVVAGVLVAAALPGLNAITEASIGLADFEVGTLLLFLAIALGAGLLAGSYPALYLSSFRPARVLRGGGASGAGHAGLRKGLVVFQFALSIVLIIGTLTVARQIDYIQTKHLGLDRENVLYTVLEGGLRTQYDAAREELLRQPGIAAVTASNQNPLSVGSSTTDPTWDGKEEDADILFHIINGRHGFVEAMGMELVAGRTHSADRGADSLGYVINETAARVMGMDDPVGQDLSFWGDDGQIIGVVEDFHMTSLHADIGPTIIRLDPEQTWMLWVRTAPGQTAEALASLERVHAEFNPAYPFEYTFLDERFEETYRSEMMVGTLAICFAVFAIFIACLGLFGLAAYTAERRTKEVGIRKVLGASVPHLVGLLSREFVGLVLVAFAVAGPVAFFAMRDWLDSYAYRVDLGVGVFLVACAGAIIVAAATVSVQALRAATADPVQSLRTE